MDQGLPYDSKEGRRCASRVQRSLPASPCDSRRMARELGPFPLLQEERKPMRSGEFLTTAAPPMVKAAL